MTYTFAFIGGFKDGTRVSTNSPDPQERVVAEYFRAATRRGKIGRLIEATDDQGDAYEVAEKITQGETVLVKCICRPTTA